MFKVGILGVIILASLFLVTPTSAGKYCDGSTTNLSSVVSVYDLFGTYIRDKKFNFVGEFCQTANVFLSVNDKEIILQNKYEKLTKYNIDSEASFEILSDFDVITPFKFFYPDRAYIDNSILTFIGYGNYTKYNIEDGKSSTGNFNTLDLVKNIPNIDKFESIRIYSNFEITLNYNDWLAFSYTDTDGGANNIFADIFRDSVVHISQNGIGQSIFLTNFTNFNPSNIRNSPDGKKIVLYDLFSGLGIYNFMNNKTILYNMKRDSTNIPPETLKFVSVTNEHVWALFSDNTMERDIKVILRKFDLKTGDIKEVGLTEFEDINNPVEMIINNNLILILSTTLNVGLIVFRIVLIVLIILLVLYKLFKIRKNRRKIQSDGKDYSSFMKLNNDN